MIINIYPVLSWYPKPTRPTINRAMKVNKRIEQKQLSVPEIILILKDFDHFGSPQKKSIKCLNEQII